MQQKLFSYEKKVNFSLIHTFIQHFFFFIYILLTKWYSSYTYMFFFKFKEKRGKQLREGVKRGGGRGQSRVCKQNNFFRKEKKMQNVLKRKNIYFDENGINFLLNGGGLRTLRSLTFFYAFPKWGTKQKIYIKKTTQPNFLIFVHIFLVLWVNIKIYLRSFIIILQ